MLTNILQSVYSKFSSICFVGLYLLIVLSFTYSRYKSPTTDISCKQTIFSFYCLLSILLTKKSLSNSRSERFSLTFSSRVNFYTPSFVTDTEL